MPQRAVRENPCRGRAMPQIRAMTLRILYNGGCPICAREIAHYRRLASRSAAPLAFEDLRDANLEVWNLDADTARRRLHALDGDSRLDGFDAFHALWSLLPGWRWLARVTGLPLIRPVVGYVYERLLAPWLYRRSVRACLSLTGNMCGTIKGR